MSYLIEQTLPADLPQSWNDSLYVSPNGSEVGLSEKYGYNYLMKQVNNCQKALNTVDNILISGSTNFIDNSYFFNLLNRRKGFIALKGTTYYIDDDLNLESGETTGMVKATYLNNNVSCIDIDGEMFYVRTDSLMPGFIVGSSGSFVFDRWWAKNCTLLKESAYSNLSITGSSSAAGVMRQAVQCSDSLAGRLVVFSVLVTGITGEANICIYKSYSSTGNNDQLIVSKKLSYGLNYVSEYVPQDVGKSSYKYLVCSIEPAKGANIKVSAVKLQTGDVPTLAYYDEAEDEWYIVDVPNPVVEALRCNIASVAIGGIGMLIAPEDIGLHAANTVATAEIV